MVQMMPVLRAVVGLESMSSRHMCSRKVSAMAALSCCVWMKAEPMSRDFDWGMAITGATGEVLRGKKCQKVNIKSIYKVYKSRYRGFIPELFTSHDKSLQTKSDF